MSFFMSRSLFHIIQVFFIRKKSLLKKKPQALWKGKITTSCDIFIQHKASARSTRWQKMTIVVMFTQCFSLWRCKGTHYTHFNDTQINAGIRLQFFFLVVKNHFEIQIACDNKFTFIHASFTRYSEVGGAFLLLFVAPHSTKAHKVE